MASEPVSCLVEFDPDELAAILALDFERALECSQHKCQRRDNQAAEEEAHYREQAMILSQQNYDTYNERLNQIKEEYQQSADKHKTLWQGYCRSLVAKQREEAEELEQKWIAAREEELARTAEAANAKLSTARILAMCNQYENAIAMRDTAKSLIGNEKTARVRKIDADFTRRYKQMTARHFSEFQYLHKHLTCLMDTLREKVKAQGLAAEADLKMEEARNATLIIQTVAQEAVSPIAKENVIRAFSPRSQKRPGSRSSMTMSQSSGRNTPSKAATSPRFQTPVGK